MKQKLLVSKILLASALLILIYGLAVCLSGLTDDVFSADVAVVLGNEVYADGMPSPRLAARLDRGLELYLDGIAPKIIVSGGIGKSGADEARAMAAYLESKGVAAEDLIVDSEGVNTAATARFTAAWLDDNAKSSAIAVSQYFHLPRCRLAFLQAGIFHLGWAHARYFEWRDIFSICRELLGLPYYWLKY